MNIWLYKLDRPFESRHVVLRNRLYDGKERAFMPNCLTKFDHVSLPIGISGGPWPDDRQPTQQVRGVAPLSSLPSPLQSVFVVKELYLRAENN